MKNCERIANLALAGSRSHLTHHNCLHLHLLDSFLGFDPDRFYSDVIVSFSGFLVKFASFPV